MAAPNRKWTFDRFGAFDSEQEAAVLSAKHFAPISDRYAFNPSGDKSNGWHGDVSGREYQKWLEAQKRAFTDGWDEIAKYRASADVTYDYSKGLFGKPREKQPAVKFLAKKLGVFESELPSILERHHSDTYGQVATAPTHLDAFDALKVRDPETGQMRYTDGFNDGWDPEGKAADLDRTVKSSAGYERAER